MAKRKKAELSTWISKAESVDDVLRGADHADMLEWIKERLEIGTNVVVIIENEDMFSFDYNCTNERANWLVDSFKREIFKDE